MVGARDPAGIKAAHPVLAGQNILQGVIKSMAQVQGTCNIGRGDDHAEWRLALAGLGRENVQLGPEFQTAFLSFPWFKSLGQFGGHRILANEISTIFVGFCLRSYGLIRHLLSPYSRCCPPRPANWPQ